MNNIICETSDSWKNLTDCTPVVCDNFTIPDHANVGVASINGRVFGDVIGVICEEGYNATGAYNVTCESNRQWSDAPVCDKVQCGNISVIANGTIQNETGTSYGDTATVVCEQNYKLNGSGNMSCESNGEWNGTPECVLKKCDAFQVSDIILIPASIEASAVGTKIDFECEVGYTSSGSNTVTCQEDETWSDLPICEIVDCGETNNITNGSVIETSGTTYNSYATYQCDTGYSMIGKPNITCNVDGLWDTHPDCVSLNCSDLVTPQNSKIENLTILCDEGYDVAGNSSIVCMPDGQWNEYGECMPVTCAPFPTPENAISSGNSPAQYSYGDEVNVTCKGGFELSNVTPATCNASGGWTNVGTCYPIDCDVLQFPKFATESGNATHKFDDEVNITCIDGYKITNQTAVTCDINGIWNSLPECLPISCDSLSLPNFATVSNPTLDNFVFGEKVNISCQTGYELSGDLSVGCDVNGTWNNLPSCLPILCDSLLLPDNATVSTSTLDNFVFGEKVNISCQPGYELSGDLSVGCDVNGTWNNLPSCLPILCDSLSLPDNATVSTSTLDNFVFGEKVNISCQPGYELSGNFRVGCDVNGTWNNLPSCLPILCDSLSLPKFATVSNPTLDNFVFGEEVNISCQPGYELSGNFRVGCDVNGTWNNLPSCLPILCDSLSLPNFATVSNPTLDNFVFGEEVNISCQPGYDFSGDSSVGCDVNGTWNNLPSCLPISCDSLSLPNFATVSNPTLDNFVFGEEVNISCQPGYELSGDSSVGCDVNGTWNNLPSCVPITCDDYVLPDNSFIDGVEELYWYGDELPLLCEEGYFLSDNVTIKCNESGQWDDFPTCTMVECGMFNLPSNMTLDESITPQDQYVFNYTVSVACEMGFELNGDSEITCLSSGSWSVLPSCEIITCPEYSTTVLSGEVANVTGNAFGDIVTILCNNDTIINVSCVSNGEWEPTPNCASVSCESYEVLNGTVFVTDADNISSIFAVGAVVQVRCDTGYELVGDTDTVNCTENGIWSKNITCTSVMCSTNLTIYNTVTVIDSGAEELSYGSNLEVQCKSGLQLDDGSRSTNLTCNATGVWEGKMCGLGATIQFGGADNTFDKDSDAFIYCNITNYESAHTVMIAKYNGTEEPIFLYRLADTTSSESPASQNMNFSYTETETDLSILIEFTPVSETHCGTYMCAVTVFDDNEEALDYKMENASVGITGYSNSCEIITCSAYSLTVLYGKVVNVTGNGFGDIVTIVCDNDTIINVSCLSNGEWESTPNCTSLSCQPYEVLNGNVFVNDADNTSSVFAVGTAVQVECDTGYELVGDTDTVNCSENGIWSKNITCTSVMCSTNLTIYNTVTVIDSAAEELSYGSNLEVQCKSGLQLDDGSRSTNLTCNATGVWDGEKMCGLGATIQFGGADNTFDKDSDAFIYCNITNYESAHTVMIAKYNGTEEPIFLYRLANTTSFASPASQNMNFSYTVTEADLSVLIEFTSVSETHCGTYMCAVTVFDDNDEALDYKMEKAIVEITGYSYPDISVSSTSLTLGKYETITCTGHTVDQTADDSMRLEVKYDNDISFNVPDLSWSITSELIACHNTTSKFYTVSAANFTSNATVRCALEGIGNISFSEEVRITTTFYLCGDNELNIPDNSQIETSSATTMVNIICNEGYYMEGNNATECQSGNWTEIGTCLPISCPSFPSPDNSHDNITGTFMYGDKVNITCLPGFDISINAPAVCNSSGEWTDIPSCSPKECNLLPVPDNATFENQTLDNIMFGDKVNISCEVGFELSGNSTIKCDINGNWNTEEFPSCTPVECVNYTLPFNSFIIGEINEYKYGDELVLSCEEGYFLSDNYSIKCNESGHWVDFPNCTEVECEMFNLPSNMTLDESYTPQDQFVFNATVSVACEMGFEQIGNSEATCLSNGSWSELPFCEITTCPEFNATIAFGEVVNSTGTEFGDIVTIQCDNASLLEVSCLANGLWETPLNCSQETCEIFEFPNGQFIGNQRLYTIGTTAEIECDEGYVTNGNLSTTACTENGTWNNNVSCTPVLCNTNFASYHTLKTVTNIDSELPYGSNQTVECIDGLTFVDESLITNLSCNSTGLWEGKTKCSIPGEVSFESETYSLTKDKNDTFICKVSNFRNMQSVVIRKANGTNINSLYTLANISGQTETQQMANVLVNYIVHDSNVTVEVMFTPVTYDNCGSYACGIFVFDENNEVVDYKLSKTNVTVVDYREPDISVSPTSVDRGEEVLIKCSGFLDTHMTDDELYLEIKYEANTSFAMVNVSDESEFTVDGCEQVTTKSYMIETTDLNENIHTRCGIAFDGETLLSEEIVVNVSAGAYATFENDSYTFNVGHNEILVCDFYGENATYVTVYNTDKTHIVAYNITSDTFEENGTFFVNSDGTFFEQTHTRFAVGVDLDLWCTKGGIIGWDNVTCEIFNNEGLISKTMASVFVSKLAGVPSLEVSDEIVEGKDTRADKLFFCRGEIGNPPGHLEVERNINGEYEMFLAPSLNETELGWIVRTNETNLDNECGTTAYIGFALKSVSMALHLSSLRCVTSPSDVENEIQVSEPKVLKVVSESHCEGVNAYSFISHPYYCHSAVACYETGLIDGVPRCPSDDQCYDTREGGSQTCDLSCSIVGCVYQPILCDKTTIWSTVGANIDFNCNILDIGEPVSGVSLSENTFNIDEIPTTLTAMDNINITLTDTQAVLSIENVTCDNEQDYKITFNNKWNVTLQVSVESTPGTPFMTLPETLSANQEIKIVCNGSVGRDNNNQPIASLSLEVKEEVGMAYVVYSDQEIRQPDGMIDCQFFETVTYTIILTSNFNGSFVRCTTIQNSTVIETSDEQQLILGVPDIYCNPPLDSSYAGDVVSFDCRLQDISDISNIFIGRIDINDEVVAVIDETVDNLPWNNSGSFDISIPSSDQVSLAFTNVSCSQEGEYIIKINNASSANVRVAVTSPSSVPMLYVSNTTRVNQKMIVNCTAELGRDDNGDQASELFIEVKSDNETEFQVYSQGVETNVSLDNCNYVGAVSLSLYADESWNNSVVRCVTKNGDINYNISEEVNVEVTTSAITFTGESEVGIVGESYIMTCVVREMTDITDIVMNKDDNPNDIKFGDDVEILTNDINDDVANLTIKKTIQCGDDGVYYCRTKGNTANLQKYIDVAIEWKATKPVIDLSVDIVENSAPWADFYTLCTANRGSNNASVFFQTNRNGAFEDIEPSIDPIIMYNSSSCSNEVTIAFFTTYTAEWNETIFRCGVRENNVTMFDAEVIYVVPETLCNNEPTGTIIPNPFDCRGEFTCTDNPKKITPRKLCSGTDECYNRATSICGSCEDVGQCREDPLDVTPYLECSSTTMHIGQNTSIDCNYYHMNIATANVVLIHDGIVIIRTNETTPVMDGSAERYSASDDNTELLVTMSSISVEWTSIVCEDDGSYTLVIDNGTSQANSQQTFEVYSSPDLPTLSKSPDKYYLGVETTITCSGPTGRPAGSINLLFRHDATEDFQLVQVEASVNQEPENCSFYGELSYSFVVRDAHDGNEYKCISNGHDGSTIDSSIDQVVVEGSNVYFVEDRITSPIGETFNLQCVFKDGSGTSGAIITLTSPNGTVSEVCQVDGVNMNSTCQDDYTAVGEINGNNMTINVSANSTCHQEGNFKCYSSSLSEVKATCQLSVTRQSTIPTLVIPLLFAGVKAGLGTFYCESDVGYPSSTRVLKVQNSTMGDSNFEDYKSKNASGDCAVSEDTKVSVWNIAFDISENGTVFKCVIYDTSTDEIISETNSTQLIVLENNCPTNTNNDVYLPHPLNCKDYLWCYSGGSVTEGACQGTFCYNSGHTNASDLCGDCVTLGCDIPT
ncbi:Coagulation factor 5/8 C-terminal domain [Mactra antiquata]